MRVLETPSAAHEWSAAHQRAGRRIALVPTMGALHDGHLALVDEARRRAAAVCVSIFVNPLQFDHAADFDAYPRLLEDDLRACETLAVDAVYAPTGSAMYSPSFQTRVVPGPLADGMEGAMRPGHFEGVTTVVMKLLSAVRPDVAVFGEKDFQQLAIVRRMVVDLDLAVEVVGHPVVREPDGLAMSSRNVRLDRAQRAAAVCIPRALDVAAETARTPGATVRDVVAAARDVVDREPLARHEYTTVFRDETLEPVPDGTVLAGADPRDDVVPAAGRDGTLRIATAVWFGDVRLIDNRPLHSRG